VRDCRLALERNKRDSDSAAALWYTLQDLLLVRDSYWAHWAAERARLGLRPLPISHDMPAAIFSFAVNRTGGRRLTLQPRIAGGAQGSILRCRAAHAAGAIIVHAEGEIDASTASELEAALGQAFTQHRRVIVDLSGVSYLDGRGIRVLSMMSGRNGGRFVVVATKPNVYRLFAVLNLIRVLPVVESLQDAEEYLRSQ
jgi:anti-anti-sigma factor